MVVANINTCLGNGILSLAEVDKAMRDVLAIDDLFDSKPAIMRAFQLAKNCTKSKRSDGHGDDYIEKKEFRYFYFLCSLCAAYSRKCWFLIG